MPFGAVSSRTAARRDAGANKGYGDGADPSAPDPTQLKPRLPRDD